MTRVRADHEEKPKTCSDCGLSPIPRLEVCYVGAALTCSACAAQPPKRITMYSYGHGSLWHNNTVGGEAVEYVRADLVAETRKVKWELRRRCRECGQMTRVTTAGCDHCDHEDK